LRCGVYMTIQILAPKEFQRHAIELFKAECPFVVRDLLLPAQLYQTTLRLLQSEPLKAFNLLSSTAGHPELRTYHTLLEAIDALQQAAASTTHPLALWQEYGQRFAQYVLRSDRLDPSQDFNLQLDVLPGTLLSREVVFPATRAYSDLLRPVMRRHYLNTVVNISASTHPLRNQKKNIHGHNYDTFSLFAEVDTRSCVYFFPPDDYLHFQTRLVVAQPGILLLIPAEQCLTESVFARAEVCHALQPGDLVYTPPLWFHCFEHAQRYLNIANGEFFPDWHAERQRHISPERFGSDAKTLRWHAERLPSFRP
jgi:hypothetical protein